MPLSPMTASTVLVLLLAFTPAGVGALTAGAPVATTNLGTGWVDLTNAVNHGATAGGSDAMIQTLFSSNVPSPFATSASDLNAIISSFGNLLDVQTTTLPPPPPYGPAYNAAYAPPAPHAPHAPQAPMGPPPATVTMIGSSGGGGVTTTAVPYVTADMSTATVDPNATTLATTTPISSNVPGGGQPIPPFPGGQPSYPFQGGQPPPYSHHAQPSPAYPPPPPSPGAGGMAPGGSTMVPNDLLKFLLGKGSPFSALAGGQQQPSSPTLPSFSSGYPGPPNPGPGAVPAPRTMPAMPAFPTMQTTQTYGTIHGGQPSILESLRYMGGAGGGSNQPTGSAPGAPGASFDVAAANGDANTLLAMLGVKAPSGSPAVGANSATDWTAMLDGKAAPVRSPAGANSANDLMAMLGGNAAPATSQASALSPADLMAMMNGKAPAGRSQASASATSPADLMAMLSGKAPQGGAMPTGFPGMPAAQSGARMGLPRGDASALLKLLGRMPQGVTGLPGRFAARRGRGRVGPTGLPLISPGGILGHIRPPRRRQGGMMQNMMMMMMFMSEM